MIKSRPLKNFYFRIEATKVTEIEMSEPKKTLSELSREELIEKCKHFLQLAQKAKTAKDGEIL